MHNRIKELRNTLGLTQEKFANELKIKRGAVANYEIGRNTPIDAVINLICREFGVSEEWLRTGNGDMFVPQTEDEELARLVGDVLRDDALPFRKKLVHLISGMSDEEINKLEKYARFLLDIEKESE